MGAAAVRYTYAEYLALERRTNERYEYFDGEVRVEHHERAESGAWTYRVYGPGNTMLLSVLDIAVPVDALFRNLPDDAP